MEATLPVGIVVRMHGDGGQSGDLVSGGLGWLIKTRVLRYLDGESYKKPAPLFIGLFVGGYIEAAIWSVVGVVA